MKTKITPEQVIEKILDPNTSPEEVIVWWGWAWRSKSFGFAIHERTCDKVVQVATNSFPSQTVLQKAGDTIRSQYELDFSGLT